ncbi:MAG: class II aldolase/adducin family protein [Candidatus Micrarchaeota archaeon]|nr:class II aldolase/adducin family protein [Candidatus Micrarchaeota archaeon]
MVDEEGYVKFTPVWEGGAPIDAGRLKELIGWRQRLYGMGLIGMYPNGVGFGNISERLESGSGQFIISGTATGGIKSITPKEFTLVTRSDTEANKVWCTGPVNASSETMTHAAVYNSDDSIGAVIHVHSLPFWKALLGKVPTTSPDAAYGTPEMAREITRLFNAERTRLWSIRTIAMGGHEEGILSFGKTLDDAGNSLVREYQRFSARRKLAH